MTAQPYNRFVFVSWSWHLRCNGNQALEHLCISEKSDACGLCICYLKVIKGEVSLSTLLGTLGVFIKSLLFRYFDGLLKIHVL